MITHSPTGAERPVGEYYTAAKIGFSNFVD